jgi:hypothetical protein
LLLLWFGSPKAGLWASCRTTSQPKVRRDVLDNERLDTPYDDGDQSKADTVFEVDILREVGVNETCPLRIPHCMDVSEVPCKNQHWRVQELQLLP